MSQGKMYLYILTIISLSIILINGTRTVIFQYGAYEIQPPLWLLLVDFLYVFTTNYYSFHLLFVGVFVSFLILGIAKITFPRKMKLIEE